VKFYFVAGARKEHLDAIAYYEAKRNGLGREYLAEFKHTMEQVCTLPTIYALEVKPDIRRVRLKKFPYTVLFRQTNNQIQILAIAHHRRQPNYWVERL
jgi:plasmid stabilization system protein ParE